MSNNKDFLIMGGEEEEETKAELPKTEEPIEGGFTDSNIKSDVRNIIELPSMGRLGYPSNVEYRDMMYADEKTLSGADETNYQKTMNYVMKSLMNDPDFYEEISITDRDYFFLMMFASNYSQTTDFNVACRNDDCGKESKHTVDLTQLDVVELDEDYTEPFKIPVSNNREAHARLPRIKDEVKAEAILKRVNKNGENNMDSIDVFMGLCTDIIQEDGNTLTLPIDKKVDWMFNNLSVKDINNIRKFWKYFDYGVNEVVELECPHCGEVSTYSVPFRVDDLITKAISDDFDGMLQLNKTS